jgi:CelD/BcsL family acetyltransferase involved in cellulose biosynthesis
VPELALLSPESPRWRTFAVEHATSPLQAPAWLDALTGAYRLHARVLALTDSRGAILAGLPMVASKLPWRRRWTSLPFTDTLEPLAVDRARRDELLIAAAEAAAGTAVGTAASAVGARPILVRTQVSLPGWFSRRVGTVQTIDLSHGVEGALRDAHVKTRRNIKRARRPDAGLTARPIAARGEFLGPCLALMARSRSRLGAPTQPRRYWTRLWEMHERDEALTIGVYRDGRLLAVEIAVVGPTHAAFKYSASDLATRRLRTNYLALATALEHVAARGVRSVDFGFTDVRNESLRAYKARWGGEERPAVFSATDPSLLPATLEPGRLLTRAIQRMPVFVGRTVGSVAYPFVA